MTGAVDYREMARDCIREADGTKNPERKQALLGIAKLYNQTALAMEAAQTGPLPPHLPDSHAEGS